MLGNSVRSLRAENFTSHRFLHHFWME